MLRSALLLLLVALLPQQENVRPYPDTAEGVGLSYTADGQFKMPEHYREWVFLTSGIDMSYSPKASMMGHSMFDNVFVNPSSYRAFLQNGTWPDKTTLVLEIRGAEGASSINKSGHTQSPEIMGIEVHVKDAKLEGGWGFFEFDSPQRHRQRGEAPRRLLSMPRESRRRRLDLRPVLPNSPGTRKDKRHVEPGLPQRDQRIANRKVKLSSDATSAERAAEQTGSNYPATPSTCDSRGFQSA